MPVADYMISHLSFFLSLFLNALCLDHIHRHCLRYVAPGSYLPLPLFYASSLPPIIAPVWSTEIRRLPQTSPVCPQGRQLPPLYNYDPAELFKLKEDEKVKVFAILSKSLEGK